MTETKTNRSETAPELLPDEYTVMDMPVKYIIEILSQYPVNEICQFGSDNPSKREERRYEKIQCENAARWNKLYSDIPNLAALTIKRLQAEIRELKGIYHQVGTRRTTEPDLPMYSMPSDKCTCGSVGKEYCWCKDQIADTELVDVLDMIRDGGPEEGTTFEDWARNIAGLALAKYKDKVK